MNRSDYPTTADYLRALKDDSGSLTRIGTIQARYSKGERDPEKLLAPPMPASQISRRARKASAWNKLSPAICYK